MTLLEQNKQTIRDSIEAVWERRDLAALPEFWTEDCVNHAMPGPGNSGLDALRAYHEAFMADFAAFSAVQIKIEKQVAEDDQVVTSLTTRATHTGPFFGIPPSGKDVSLVTIRIDRLRDGRIAEHWSVADAAGLMQQIQS